MLINVAGLFHSLRSPLVDASSGDLSSKKVLPARRAFNELAALGYADKEGLLLSATQIVGDAILHIDGDHRWPSYDPRYREYHYVVPLTENWILFSLRYLHPSTYLYYEFCDWRRALTRGIGRCGQQSATLIGFLRDQGIPAGLVALAGHTVVTAEASPDHWFVLDPDFGVAMPFAIDELTRNRALLERYYANHLDKGPWSIYTSSEPKIVMGGAEIRFPRACKVERVAYWLKWLVPALMIGLGSIALIKRQKLHRTLLSNQPTRHTRWNAPL